jgi:hypothetical protein
MSSYNILYRQSGDLAYAWTEFEEIYKLFLNGISNDYRIKQMFLKDEAVAEDMLLTWLSKAVTYFTDCLQDLENNFDIENGKFTLSLTLTEKVILADLMLLTWMDWNINNITQMNLSLQDSDFNRHAEAQNLRSKVAYANEWRERVYHQISEYTHKDITIADWATGGNL